MNDLQYSGTRSFPDISGQVAWQSPSNIALTKYWGKHGHQLPRNPSISFTLSNARSETSVSFEKKVPGDDIDLTFFFEEEEQPKFKDRIVRYLEKNEDHFPYIKEYAWVVRSKNTFPHSSGIASSASAMSALVMCLCDIERSYFGSQKDEDDFYKRASFLSRLASGSACRSVYPQLAMWGAHEKETRSSDLFAIPMGQIMHDVFKSYHDDILIVSADEKSVSSSAGHQLMETNPYAATRFQQAADNTIEIIEHMKSGDLASFIRIVESEALTLHALMMTGDPSFILMKPNTLQVIEAIIAFREKTGTPICFTLDAGPNVHILYPDEHAEACQAFIEGELFPFAHEGRIIMDKVGTGPSRI
jgi:diphosphomevalonate decarboxylase